MPTAARLAGATFFAILAWVVSEQVKPLMPEGVDLGLFSEYNIMIGVLAGWITMGSRANGGYNEALGGGLTTAIVMLFWGLLIYSIIEMVKESMKMRYAGPVEAVVAIFQVGFEYGLLIGTVGVIGTLMVGGAIGGIFCAWVAMRWK